jgi:hypothetical protein
MEIVKNITDNAWDKKLNRRVKIFVLSTIIFSIGFTIYILGNSPKEYKAVLMQEKPSITWKQEGRFFRKIEKIKVFSPELGTVIATIPNINMTNDNYFDTDLILERDTYPPARGKVIYVILWYKNEELIIKNAWAE